MHTVLLFIILLLIITFICYHYEKKMYNPKLKIINFKKFVLKIVLVIISMTIKLADFNLEDILIDEKSHDSKILRIRFNRING